MRRPKKSVTQKNIVALIFPLVNNAFKPPALFASFEFCCPSKSITKFTGIRKRLAILSASSVLFRDSKKTIDFGKNLIIKGTKRSGIRSEEHTSELQSRFDLVCRLLL